MGLLRRWSPHRTWACCLLLALCCSCVCSTHLTAIRVAVYDAACCRQQALAAAAAEVGVPYMIGPIAARLGLAGMDLVTTAVLHGRVRVWRLVHLACCVDGQEVMQCLSCSYNCSCSCWVGACGALHHGVFEAVGGECPTLEWPTLRGAPGPGLRRWYHWVPVYYGWHGTPVDVVYTL